jgi:hypothetical protein
LISGPKAVLKDDAVPSLTRKVEKPTQKSPNRRTSRRLKRKKGQEDSESYGSESSDEEAVVKKPSLEEKPNGSSKKVPKPDPPLEAKPSTNTSIGFVITRLEALSEQLKEHRWDNCAACLEKLTSLLDHISESHNLPVPQPSDIKSRLTSPPAPNAEHHKSGEASSFLKELLTSPEKQVEIPKKQTIDRVQSDIKNCVTSAPTAEHVKPEVTTSGLKKIPLPPIKPTSILKKQTHDIGPSKMNPSVEPRTLAALTPALKKLPLPATEHNRPAVATPELKTLPSPVKKQINLLKRQTNDKGMKMFDISMSKRSPVTAPTAENGNSKVVKR